MGKQIQADGKASKSNIFDSQYKCLQANSFDNTFVLIFQLIKNNYKSKTGQQVKNRLNMSRLSIFLPLKSA